MSFRFKRKIIKGIKQLLYRKKYRLSRLGNINLFEDLVYKIYNKNSQFCFIQIGANDGNRYDPIHDFALNNSRNVKGYVLEPIQFYFQELKETYKKNPNIIPLNVAIHNTEKEMIMYKVDFDNYPHLPEFAHGISSFSKEHHKKTGIPDEAILEEKVRCVTLNELIEEYNIGTIDLLIMDTEGYDSEILSGIDFSSFVPKIILFEHGVKLNTMSKAQLKSILGELEKNGYSVLLDESDAMAYKKNVLIEQLISFDDE